MINCCDEFLDHIKDKDVLCAELYLGKDYIPNRQGFFLRVGYSVEEWKSFCKRLNFQYDEGYGCQVLFGIVWYKDGTWSQRHEYDGREWWDHMICPRVPDSLDCKCEATGVV